MKMGKILPVLLKGGPSFPLARCSNEDTGAVGPGRDSVSRNENCSSATRILYGLTFFASYCSKRLKAS